MHFAGLTFPELGCIIDLSTRGNEREVNKMIIITKRKNIESAIAGGFIMKQLTKNIYIARMYGNKELHPIGYHIPILIIVKNS